MRKGISDVKAGKLAPDVLQAAVLGKLGSRRSDVIVRAGLGEDSAVLDFDGDLCVASSDPITGAEEGAGRLAVLVSCNDLGAMGAEPVGLLVTMLLPEGATAEQLSALVDEVEDAAAGLGAEVVGGHTEITSLVMAPIIVVTAIGRTPKNHLCKSSGAKIGDTLLLTKAAGIEGTAVLAQDFADLLAELSPDVLARAQALGSQISSVKEGMVAARNGATALHDVTEGGVVGACMELSRASGLGAVIYRPDVPVYEETRRICDLLGLDPLRLISSGAMLIAADKPHFLEEALAKEGVEVSRIGHLDRGASRIVEADGRETPISGHIEDELWRFLAQQESRS